jgi:hypothetical protein
VNKLAQFKTDFSNIDKIKCFEVPVIDIRTSEPDFILFNIEVRNSFLYAFHVATTKKEEKSKKAAFVKIKIDTDFSIDEHLQELFSQCTLKIINSEFYKLND